MRPAGTAGGGFEQTTQDAIRQRLHRPPDTAPEPSDAAPPPPSSPLAPSRWTLTTIQQTLGRMADLEVVADFTLSGVWRLLQRCHIRWRQARVPLYSPDPQYLSKVAQLERCLRHAARCPEAVVLLFVDEMGYYHWPEPAPDWMLAAPVAPRTPHCAGATNRQQRIIGALNAVTGRVDFRDDYLIGRVEVARFYRQLDWAYAWAERIYLVQDNWSIHQHPEVLAALARLPRVEVVWLPTYAPWLNPIEKLWRWLRQDVLKLHRWADAWPTLRQRVNAFLAQFANGSSALLRYTGLIGDGHLAYVLRSA